MTVFKRTLLAEDGIAKVRTETLGNNTGQYGTKNIGTLVKLTANAMVQVAANDEINGSVISVESYTANDGFSVGSVKQSHRIQAVVGANGDTTAVTVGSLVVADVQPTLATGGVGHVKVGTPTRHKWEVIYVSGAGAAGDTVILEKV